MEGLDLPRSILSTPFYSHDDQAKMLRETLIRFSLEHVKPRASKMDMMDHIDVSRETVEIIRKAAEIRLLSLIVPEHLGGMGGLTYIGANALEVLGYFDAGVATSIGAVWLGLLPVFIAGFFDGGVSWEKWFKPFVEAEEAGEPQIWAFAITEPIAGSDYERIEPGSKAKFMTVAEKKGDGYILNGHKIFISNGPIASHISVFAVTDVENPYESMMCFVVTKDMGVKVETIFDKMGHRSSPTGELIFEDVYVPKENVLCPGGMGWDVVKISLAMSRAPVGAIGLGIAKRAFDLALDYSLKRFQGGKRLFDHQIIKYKLSKMLENIVYAEYSIYGVTRKLDSSFPPSTIESSYAKAIGADIAVANSIEAIQIHGGYGYMRDMGVEKLLRDAKLIQIYEGTNEINRLTAIEEYLEGG